MKQPDGEVEWIIFRNEHQDDSAAQALIHCCFELMLSSKDLNIWIRMHEEILVDYPKHLYYSFPLPKLSMGPNSV